MCEQCPTRVGVRCGNCGEVNEPEPPGVRIDVSVLEPVYTHTEELMGRLRQEMERHRSSMQRVLMPDTLEVVPVVDLTPCPTHEEVSDLLTVVNFFTYDQGMRGYFDTGDRDGSETADEVCRNLKSLYNKMRPFAAKPV